MPKKGAMGTAKAKAVPAGGSSSKGRNVSGVLTMQTTLDHNQRWKEFIPPAIEKPIECVGEIVSVEGSFWEDCTETEGITDYDCKVIRYRTSAMMSP